MYQITIDSEVLIAGCPKAGLEAVDYRSKVGLPPEPTNKFALQYKGESEEVCRAWPQYLDSKANMELGRYSNSSLTASIANWETRSRCEPYSLDPELIKAWLADPASALGWLIKALHAAAEANEREIEAKRRAKAAEQAALPLDKQTELTYRDDTVKVIVPLRYYPDLAAPAQAEADRINALRAERMATAEREAAEREAEAARDRAEWIEAHGSERLRRCTAEGIECEAAYRDERIAAERPGWRWERKVAGQDRDPRNPPVEAFMLLDEARKVDPQCTLRRWVVDHECNEDCVGGDCPKYDFAGYVAMGKLLGQDIIFGGPDED